MRDYKISDTEITWENIKQKHGGEIKYKNQILNHGDHISISKTMYVEEELKRQDLTHIPLELIRVIDKLKKI